MSKSVAFRTVVSGDIAGPVVDKSVTIADGDAVDDFSVTVAPSVTDQAVVFAVALAALKLYQILSDQNISLQTNNAAAPTDTIALVANEPIDWHTKANRAKHFTADITAMYLTTGAITGNATVRFIFVRDSTP